MGGIQVSGHLFRKSVVKDMNGGIISMRDEASGGWIVRNRQIVNREKWDELVAKEKDRKLAAQAAANQKVDPNAPDRTKAPSNG